ncbi:uncharacterized protein LOC124268917 [Haliotis rubra]|uniref:uncharacterized protein LOC124268917 n=1 Tax=Haliotis rubra TaxID=36100 RepID=UPI001EE561F3|nr:uncharacterized protein LOC124268917 [Haliotis rubra]
MMQASSPNGAVLGLGGDSWTVDSRAIVGGNGECQCEAGYGASDCSVDITEPPKTFGLKEDGVCDVTTRTCNIDYNNSVTYGEALPQALEVESIAEGVCSLPAAPLVMSASNTVARGYLVSVSNDGKAYSDESAVVIFNSSCQECDVANNVVTCRFVSQACKSGDVCVSFGHPHPRDSCHVCSDGQWVPSTAFDDGCQPDNNMLIIAYCFGGALVIGLLIGLVLWFRLRSRSPNACTKQRQENTKYKSTS